MNPRLPPGNTRGREVALRPSVTVRKVTKEMDATGLAPYAVTGMPLASCGTADTWSRVENVRESSSGWGTYGEER